jgi:hypothetical protein
MGCRILSSHDHRSEMNFASGDEFSDFRRPAIRCRVRKICATPEYSRSNCAAILKFSWERAGLSRWHVPCEVNNHTDWRPELAAFRLQMFETTTSNQRRMFDENE